MAQETIDILQERLKLYRLQENRVDLDAGIEKKLGKTFPSLNQDIRLLREMLTDLDQIQNRKTDHKQIPEII